MASVTAAFSIVCLAYELSCNLLGNYLMDRIWEFMILSNPLAKCAMDWLRKGGISEIHWAGAQWIGT